MENYSAYFSFRALNTAEKLSDNRDELLHNLRTAFHNFNLL